ncbi:MAG: hypothetical protein EBV15_09805 [Bacteroidetes bacterium]|nr:hypothetical protein [Bacteroidota bacterium]
MSNKLYIQELHHLHIQWNSALDFACVEISSFENQLQKIAKANTAKQILAQVEHFQNQFIRQKEVIDVLRHDIHEDAMRISDTVMKNNTALEHRMMKVNLELNYSMEKFQKIFNELRIEYMRFLGEKL